VWKFASFASWQAAGMHVAPNDGKRRWRMEKILSGLRGGSYGVV
jgi:hypothetical protein